MGCGKRKNTFQQDSLRKAFFGPTKYIKTIPIAGGW
jgi:hypothetical protein